MRIYLDSNVLISALRSEIGKNFRLLASEADDFLACVAKSSAIIIILSDFCLWEIKKKIYLDEDSIMEYLNSLSINAERIDSMEDDIREAKKIERMGVHPQDSRHAAIALRTTCDCIVTFNKKDFEPVQHLIVIKEPAEFR